MKLAAKFTISLNTIPLNDCTSAITYLKLLLQNQQQIDKILIHQSLTDNQNRIIGMFKQDSYQLVQFVKYAQDITQDPLNSYQNYLNDVIQKRFPSKPFLLKCLQLNSQCNLQILQSMPNAAIDTLPHSVLNKIITTQQLDYKESTTVLHFLHNKKLLKQLLQCAWVQNYIQLSKFGLQDYNLKNLALLSRIYADIGTNFLNQVANSVEKMDLSSDQSNQWSLITLYQNLSLLRNKQELLRRIANLIILNDKVELKDLMQLLIGVSQSKDDLLAQRLFFVLRKLTLNEEDLPLFYLCGTYFKQIEPKRIDQEFKEGNLHKILLLMTPKQMGEFCVNLFRNYQINLCEFITKNKQIIHPQNIVNLISINNNNVLELDSLVEEYLKNKLIDIPGVMKLATYQQYQKTISTFIVDYQYYDIAFNVKELAAILLQIDKYLPNLGRLVEFSLQAVNNEMSSAQGLANIIYLASKKDANQDITLSVKIIKKIIDDCDPIELLNFLRVLEKNRELFDQLKMTIMDQINKRVDSKNRQRVEKHIQKLPKHLHFQLQ
ncbi:unnamed protein product (macronuclear) [Paramecium tetraurelia]|uniref:Uncharacterized protein n=1 Tax=Paramecium tetraurelia TaxID=5888 RepID=A0E964_PARTE|nr:uncharacterized protein GSPATT00024562001 [Paramecium tetraurelia]CAK91831.1 unnamed protein product [Paramecium tetraurelia]|eukprot:XP_001459228.1 hypothetical protein (macronuclear) [Paramecium tetraurelia strain d4-2]